MVYVYICRHGTTAYNERGKLQGQLNSNLLTRGRQDAKHVAKLINVHIDRIVSSDLNRAKQTADIIRKLKGLPFHVKTDRRLREINYGTAAGMLKTEAKKKFPRYKKDPSFRFPNGESYTDVQRRAGKAIKDITKKLPNTFLS